jgi:hypothetical protein
MRSAGFVDWLVASPANAIVGRSIVHSLAPAWVRCPCKVSVPSLILLAFVLVKTAVHPVLHSFPMLSRLASPSAGN